MAKLKTTRRSKSYQLKRDKAAKILKKVRSESHKPVGPNKPYSWGLGGGPQKDAARVQAGVRPKQGPRAIKVKGKQYRNYKKVVKNWAKKYNKPWHAK